MPRFDSVLRRSRPTVPTWSKAVALSLAALGLATASFAGVIDPAFRDHLATLSDDTPVSVIIMLADQAPLAVMDAELRAEAATLQVRHERVITTLQETAAASQGPLLAELGNRKSAGNVNGFTPYWIANLVVAELTVKAVREVAARPDVDIVYSNFTISLIEPVGGVPVAREEDPPQANVATPGLCAMNVRRVWSELGITGAGRLVGGFDTGVMGGHVALASRWRGAQMGVPWQHAWLDLLTGTTMFPTDTNGHGTHTMGTMVGLGVATQDTVGMAFGAQWIACNAINQGVGGAFDNDVIMGFQWFADPDGNPNTTNDVPDVVQNSWRINEGFPGGYVNCDTRWWAVMDGCEAAGCAVVFSAGNEGPGASTIGSPPDRITTSTNAYAIGAVDGQVCLANPNGYLMASFSSRGPSTCAGHAPPLDIKPEVSAPGVNVRSTTNNGSYGSSGWSGTSMAGPHVSGIFPLMREANPNIDVTTMKQIIMDTARDLGAAGEDNNSGWGIPNTYEAVLAAMGPAGVSHNSPTVGGRVRLTAVNPNPFSPMTLVSYQVAANQSRVALRVYDLQGRLVRTLAEGILGQGSHSSIFDGRDETGRDLSAGTYFLRIEADGERDAKKINLVR